MDKILIIDDDDFIRDNIKMMLEFEGFSVITADGGLEGYNSALANRPDVILSDVVMPEVDGFELIEKIQNNPAIAATPFIFLSGKVDAEEIRRGMSLGADDYILKPFKIETILNSIKARLRKRELYNLENGNLYKDLFKSILNDMLAPLFSIQGTASMIEENQEKLSEEIIKEYIKKIGASGRDLHGNVEKLLTYSDMLSFDKSKLKDAGDNEADYAINREMILLQLKMRAAENGRADDLDLQLEPGNILIKWNYFETILAELLDNAIRCSSKGALIKIGGSKEGGSYVIAVTVCGNNLEELSTDRTDLINPFKSFNKTVKCTNIAFSLLSKIIENFGGSVEFSYRNNRENSIVCGFPLL